MINGIEHYTEGWSQDRKDEVYARIEAIENSQTNKCLSCGECGKIEYKVEEDANFTGY